MITVRFTVLMDSGKFAPFFEILIISLTRIAVLYHKRALCNSKEVGGKKKNWKFSSTKIYTCISGKYFELLWNIEILERSELFSSKWHTWFWFPAVAGSQMTFEHTGSTQEIKQCLFWTRID